MAKTRPKLTDAERHKRFLDMAHEVAADESPEAFEKAFAKADHPQTRATTIQNDQQSGPTKVKN